MNFVGSGLMGLDILIILTAYLFLLYGQTAAGIFAFGQGFLMDLFSGGLDGLFVFLYLSAFWGMCLSSRFFNLKDAKGQAIIISIAVVMKKTIFFVVLILFSQNTVFSNSYLWVSGAAAIITGLIAPLLFYLFDRLRAIPFKA